MAAAPPPAAMDDKLSTSPDSDVSDRFDAAYERRVVRKLDKHIVPVIMLLYLFSFLDRVNIGNARLYGLEEDLGLQGNQFQVAVSILFVTYLLFEIPSNLVLKKFTPRRYIAAITTIWGIIATLTGLVDSYPSLLACRLLLGAIEAGLFPGLAVYLTLFYSKTELALRIGYLFVSAALAGACGGLLAYVIGFMDGIADMRGWRWILILEGIPTVLLGLAVYWLLADSVDTASYLSAEEKQYLAARRARESGQTSSAQRFHWADVKACFTDWKCWAFAFAQFGVDTMLYGFSTFLPTIIKAIGSWSTAQVQALTIPCYALGAITYLVVARISDRHEKRALYTLLFATVSIVGYGILLSDASSGVHYLGCFLVAMGLYVTVGLPLAWLPNNCPRYGKRTAASGFQLTVGNASGIMAPFIYLSKDSPRYIKGHAVSLSMVAFAAMVYAFLWYWYSMLNTRRERGAEDHKVEGMSEEEIAELGDESPLPPLPTQPDLKHLVIVACHAIWKGGPTLGEADEEWTLEPHQTGWKEPLTWISHIETDAQIARDFGGTAVLMFSGGETRAHGGARIESMSYYALADAHNLLSDLLPVTTTENYAKDSYENVLFSICRFHEFTGSYPVSITIVGYTFKAKRFNTVHRSALRFPEGRFAYVGVDPLHASAKMKEMAWFEAERSLQPFERDPYACFEPALVEKGGRNPGRRASAYENVCPDLKALMNWCGLDKHTGEVSYYPGKLPWVDAQ